MLTPRGAGAKEVGQAHSNHRTENWGGGCPQRNVAQTKDIFLWKYILKNVLVDMYKDAKHREKKAFSITALVASCEYPCLKDLSKSFTM